MRMTRAVLLLVLAGVLAAPALTFAGPAPDTDASPVALPNPLSMEAAKRIALIHNPDLEAAAARVRAAREVLQQAIAALRPTLRLRAGFTRVQHASPESNDPWDQYDAGMDASWLVFDGFARKFAILSAGKSVEASAAADAEARRLLLRAVAAAYLDALLARENVRIAEQDAEFNHRLMKEARKRFEAGAAARSEVLNFQIRARQAEARRISAQENFRVRRVVLAELLGLPDARLPDDVRLESITSGVLPDRQTALAQAIAEALANRPDLSRVRAELAAAEADLRYAGAQRWPRLELTGTVSESHRAGPAFRWQTDGYAAGGLVLTWDLYTGGRRSAEIREARERLRETDARLRALRLSIRSEIRRRIERLDAAGRLLKVQQEVYQLTTKTRDLVRSEYLVGRTSLARLNQAQSDLVRADADLAAARIRYRQAVEDLDAATGRDLARFSGGDSP